MSEQKQEQERTEPLPPKESSRYAWAEKEIEYARKYYSKPPMDDTTKDGKDGYTVSCMKDALKAFKTLTDLKGHTMQSMEYVKYFLNRMIDGKPLSPVEDTDDVWEYSHTYEDGTKVYDCTRSHNLFKYVAKDGKVSFYDTTLSISHNVGNGHTYRSSMTNRMVNELFPITFPYCGFSKPYIVEEEDFNIVTGEPGSFDTYAYFNVTKPDGTKVELNKFYKEVEHKSVEITKEEYYERRKIYEKLKAELDKKEEAKTEGCATN